MATVSPSADSAATVYRDIAVPPAFLDILLDPLLQVSEFLAFILPDPPTSHTFDPKIHSNWFLEEHPNYEPHSIPYLPLPPLRLASILDDNLHQALLEGKRSVQHPLDPNLRLPLCIIKAWKQIVQVMREQAAWTQAMHWADSVFDSTKEGQVAHSTLSTAIMDSPWSNAYPSLRSPILPTTLCTLLKDDWLIPALRPSQNLLQANVLLGFQPLNLRAGSRHGMMMMTYLRPPISEQGTCRSSLL